MLEPWAKCTIVPLSWAVRNELVSPFPSEMTLPLASCGFLDMLIFLRVYLLEPWENFAWVLAVVCFADSLRSCWPAWYSQRLPGACLLTMLLSCHLWYFTFDLHLRLGLLPSKSESDRLCGASEAQEPCILLLLNELLLDLFVLERIKCQKKKKRKLYMQYRIWYL
jgi:hypothetical protein